MAWQACWIDMGEDGYRVKETETHFVDVVRQIFNWRVSMTPKACPNTYDGGWCYAGTDPTRALLAALAWDPDTEDSPRGWIRNPFTGQRRPDGDPAREYVAE